jgi:serine phosphatase RsbU (regulator of sigma subunit)
MSTATPIDELIAIEKLREQELEEARIIQSAMLPSQPLHSGAVVISHEFQPIAEVGGDYLDYFQLSDGSVGYTLAMCRERGLRRRHSALQYAVFRPATAEMRIASAGMPGALLVRDGEWHVLGLGRC